MKMRLSGFLAFAVLSISILSYGVSGSAFAGSHDIGAVQKTLSIFIDSDIIANGGIVTISGNIKNYDPSALTAGDITYVIINPDGTSRVGIGQLTPNPDGSYEFAFTAGGDLWKLSGDYTIQVKYGSDTSEITVDYVGGEFVGSEPPPPPPVDSEPPPVDSEPPPVDKEPEPEPD